MDSNNYKCKRKNSFKLLFVIVDRFFNLLRRKVHIFERPIDRGTTLTYKPNWIETDTHIQNCYLDDRLGIWSALKVAENLENGVFWTTDKNAILLVLPIEEISL